MEPWLWLFLLIIVCQYVYKLFSPQIKGMIGEKTIATVLTRLDSSRYKVINNVVLNVRGRISQIDHVVISDFGIFVIETKNYKGWIMGGEYAEYWTQVIYGIPTIIPTLKKQKGSTFNTILFV